MPRLLLLSLGLFLVAPLQAQDAAAGRLAQLFSAWDAYQDEQSGLGSPDDGAASRIPVLPPATEAAFAEEAMAWQGFLDRLRAIPADELTGEDAISAVLFERLLEDRLTGYHFRAYRIPITSEGGFHTSFAWTPGRISITTVEQAEQYIALLRSWPGHVAEQIALMREGLRTGWTQPAGAIAGFDRSAAAYVTDAPEASVFWTPLAELPATIPAAEQARLQAEGRAAIAEAVVPGYETLATFFRDEYLPGARITFGASAMPDGRAYYEHLVRHFTTLDVTPEAVHELGMQEVARIRAEMDAVISAVGFDGSFADFLDLLRSDPQFYAETPEELLSYASWIAKRMDGQMPLLFGKLPRRPYGVAPVPDEIAPNYTGGRYIPGPAEGDGAGTYWVNTYALESRPLYVMEALSFHEAVPGHHLQIALAQELDHLPRFRRNIGLTAYEEGWALYAERLGGEVGFYADPYSRFGQLTYEMWRACRLVVDTGLHAFGWTRQEAIDYLASNTALSLHEVTTEIDRYITWPGQALGYKMGELTIRRLRAEAEDALGDRFDLRAFHDEVLAHGEVPMAVLETIIRDWIVAHREG
ncbi:MAG: DUF885 domain-containing protein [Rhodothermaceae bacterium]|nr:DUF885 domain-containing protein [Rhodothermaceae bacterium]